MSLIHVPGKCFEDFLAGLGPEKENVKRVLGKEKYSWEKKIYFSFLVFVQNYICYNF